MNNKYTNNPYYTIIADKLYFRTRGGKLIYCRNTTLADYEYNRRTQ